MTTDTRLNPHPDTWIEVCRAGIYCIPADAYIDPMQPVARALITHGHADHARGGHESVWATVETINIMQQRYGIEHAVVQTAVAIGEEINLTPEAEHPVLMSLYPAACKTSVHTRDNKGCERVGAGIKACVVHALLV